MEDQTSAKKPHAVVLMSPGMGHLTPTIELVKRLVTYHDFEVTLFAIVTDSSPVRSQILSSTSKIPNNEFLHVEAIKVDVSSQVPSDAHLLVRILATMDDAIPLVRSAIGAMKQCPNVFIADMFGVDYWDIADEFNMSKYVFMVTCAWSLALTVYLPEFEKEVSKEELERLDCIRVPGCRNVTRSDDIGSFDRDDEGYIWFVNSAKKIAMSEGIIVNSWDEMEPQAIRSLNDKHQVGKSLNGKVYPVGPLVAKPSVCEDAKNIELFKWMESQPDESILYISFGSGGSLTYEQIQEIAYGLELSQQRFIWVLRPPSNNDASEFYFSLDLTNNNATPLDYLPLGFLTRTKDIGIVVPMWAPQAEILGHKSIGGFLTHCGWNSIFESIVNGVPMLAMPPLYAEQEMNSTIITDDLKVAVRLEAANSNNKLSARVMGREEIEKGVRAIMVEKGSIVIRERVKKLQKSAIEAADPIKGSSWNYLTEFTKLCIEKMK